MKALLVASEYPTAPCGGIGILYHALAGRLAALGVETHVLTDGPDASGDTEAQEGDVRVHRVGLPAGRLQRVRLGRWRLDAMLAARARARAAAARRLAVRLQPDVVETHDWAAPLWRAPGRPFIVRLHGASSVLAHVRGEPAPRLQQYLERRMIAQACSIVAVSEWIKGRTCQALSIDSGRVEVIPNGIDLELFRLGGGPRREEIVFAGTLRENKGVVELLRALEIVLRARPGATASLAGGPDGWHQLSPSIRRLVQRVQMAAPNGMRLLGRIPQEELAELYRRAAVCVFPSHGEAFGLACVEAMSCGAAVIASPLGAGAEIVEDGRSGLLADPREPERLAAAIESLLAQPSLARGLGEAARRRVEERYSIERTAEATLALYERTRQAWRKERVA